MQPQRLNEANKPSQMSDPPASITLSAPSAKPARPTTASAFGVMSGCSRFLPSPDHGRHGGCLATLYGDRRDGAAISAC